MKNKKADWYFSDAKKWKTEITLLRQIILEVKELEEQVKWGTPCYTLQVPEDKKEHNVVLIHHFKDYCAVLFFKGALIEDKKGVLIQQTANVQAARQMRFTSADEILKRSSDLKKYILKAIAIEKAGLKVKLKETSDFDMTEEFRQALKESPELEKAFGLLTPGRQRAYKLFFSSAKKTETRLARIEKSIPNILKGKGLDD